MKAIIAGSSVAYCAGTAQVPDWQENIKTRNVGSSITPVLDKVPNWQQDSLNFTYHLTFIKQSTCWQLNRDSQLNIKRAILDRLFFRNMQVCSLFI
jgi:hypothetical protein